MTPWPQTVTPDAVLLWGQRAIQDYDKKVGKGASAKQKAGNLLPKKRIEHSSKNAKAASCQFGLSLLVLKPWTEIGDPRSTSHGGATSSGMPHELPVAQARGAPWQRKSSR